MNLDTLRTLDKLPLDAAKEVAVSLIDVTKTKKLVLNRLQYDISKAWNSAEVSRIMWQVYMSGTGLGTLGSAWKKHYKAA
tara:strand:+ start:583 stop:822 length:240 start_codon:yes stop_codon:yes gene_type:complete